MLHCQCKALHEVLQKLSNQNDEEIIEEQDTNGYDLIQKVFNLLMRMLQPTALS